MRLNRLETRLIAIFLAATLVPLAVTLWLTSSLLERSLSYASTAELDEISRSLEKTGREFYQRSRESLKEDATRGRVEPQRYAARDRAHWPAQVEAFWVSGEPERFLLSGDEGDRLNYLSRRGSEIWIYSRKLGGVGMGRLSRQYARAREVVARTHALDLHQGSTITWIVLGLAAAAWVVALGVLLVSARRFTRPIRNLTAALSQLASGDLSVRLAVTRDDEVGTAIRAFNNMAEQLQHSRERLVYLTRLESWQALARKTAHEVKNSLTPIRLTMEEMIARRVESDRAFLEQAAQIVIDEVNTLERRVRAFSELAAEPPVRPVDVDVNSLLEERIAFLRTAHPEVIYNVKLSPERPHAVADEDLVKGMLTNLLENAAQAAGAGGVVIGSTSTGNGKVTIEVQDSGPGLSLHARSTVFEPTISFKKGGMGLGLSIARKSALLLGGDIQLVQGELGGAAFRVLLPRKA
jgi:nitrogen fixation/metabolism regulation signal transduction histidine kinase